MSGSGAKGPGPASADDHRGIAPGGVNQFEIQRGAEALRSGRLVVFPTETVYGLGANALDPEAVARIFSAKGRPGDNPLIVHIADISELESVTNSPPALAYHLFERFSPGPLTVVLPRSSRVPSLVSAGLPTVAVRIPSHPIAQALLRAAHLPVAAPSANRSGRPSPTDMGHAREDLGDQVEVYIDGGPCQVGVESTVARIVSASGGPPEEAATRGYRVEILREGAVTREMLAEALGVQALVADVAGGTAPVSRPGDGGDTATTAAESPGTRHAHYMPEAKVVPFAGELPQVLEEPAALLLLHPLRRPPPAGSFVVTFDSLESYAHQLFRAFRDADDRGFRVIYAELPPSEGVGRALRDRIFRASGPPELG